MIVCHGPKKRVEETARIIKGRIMKGSSAEAAEGLAAHMGWPGLETTITDTPPCTSSADGPRSPCAPAMRLLVSNTNRPSLTAATVASIWTGGPTFGCDLPPTAMLAVAPAPAACRTPLAEILAGRS